MGLKYPLKGIRNLISQLGEKYIITKNVAIPYKGVDHVAPVPVTWNRNPNISLTHDKYGDIYDSVVHIYTTDNMPLDFWTAGLVNTNYTLKKEELLEGDPLYCFKRASLFAQLGRNIFFDIFILTFFL